MTRFQYQSGDRPLDGYTIEYALGRGGFGEVYYAVSDAGRQVALKGVQNYEEIELRGISHCMNLKSQHLVSIFDVKNGDDGTPWVIMEFVAGPSLRDILDESPEGLGPEKASFFVCELAKGLAYLHGAGVVHRDLKPHNVFFEDGVVKIGDYSLSKVITSSHRSGHTMTVGTVHYMAPEISMGRYDKTVDIYALGVMLYEMLTGVPPYTGDSMGEVLMKHLSAQPDVSGLEEPFASVITKSMQRDPADRYQSAEEMVSALQGVSATADSITGFGPASLSIVADRAARKVRPAEPGRKAPHRSASEDSTGRVDAALTATHREQPIVAQQVGSMRQWGRDFGGFAYHTAIAGSAKQSRRDTTAADPVSGFWRCVLAIATLLVMACVGGALTDVIGTETNTYLVDAYLAPFGATENPVRLTSLFMENIHRALMISLGIVLGAVIVRLLVRRGNLPPWAALCRLVHGSIALILLTLMLVLRLSPISGLFVGNLIAVLLPLLVQNWSLLTSPARPQRIRLWPVLFAATLAFLTGEIVGANSMLVVAIAAGSALSVQVWARFSPACQQHSQPSLPAETVSSDPGPQPVSQSSIHSLVHAGAAR